MNEHDAAMIEHTHRAQARAITREPHIDTRPIVRVLCPRCRGFQVIDRYTGLNGMEYSPIQCSCDRGWRLVYAPADSQKTRTLIAVDQQGENRT